MLRCRDRRWWRSTFTASNGEHDERAVDRRQPWRRRADDPFAESRQRCAPSRDESRSAPADAVQDQVAKHLVCLGGRQLRFALQEPGQNRQKRSDDEANRELARHRTIVWRRGQSVFSQPRQPAPYLVDSNDAAAAAAQRPKDVLVAASVLEHGTAER